MGSSLIELLDNAGLLKGTTVNEDAFKRTAVSDLIDLAEQAGEVTAAEDVEVSDSIFGHSASASLGASPSPCIMLDCRLQRARELGQFAALYSDRVFIHNFLPRLQKKHQDDEEKMRFAFRNDVAVLGELRSLIDAGKIVPITPRADVCIHCLAQDTLGGDDPDRRYRTAYEYVRARFRNEARYSLRREPAGLSLKIEGDLNLVEHGSRYIDGLPADKILDDFPRLAKRLARGSRTYLSPEEVAKLAPDFLLTKELFNSVSFEVVASQLLKTSVVTEREIDVLILEKLSGDTELEKRNHLVRQLLACNLPFLNELEPHELLKLRDTEGDSFLMFRSALVKAADEVRARNADITERDALSLYGDVIEPELARLNVLVDKERRTLGRGIRRSVLGWTAAISFGMYYGFIPERLQDAAKAIGLTKAIAELLEKAMGTDQAETAIKSENMYFLWKVKQEAAKKSAA